MTVPHALIIYTLVCTFFRVILFLGCKKPTFHSKVSHHFIVVTISKPLQWKGNFFSSPPMRKPKAFFRNSLLKHTGINFLNILRVASGMGLLRLGTVKWTSTFQPLVLYCKNFVNPSRPPPRQNLKYALVSQYDAAPLLSGIADHEFSWFLSQAINWTAGLMAALRITCCTPGPV